MAKNKEVYSLKEVLEVYDEIMDIRDLKKCSDTAEERYNELFTIKNKISDKNISYYKHKFFDTMNDYYLRLRALPIESEMKTDIINRIDKICKLRVHIVFFSEDNDNEIKKIPYIRNTIKKLMKFLKEQEIYDEGDKYFSHWIQDYFDFIIIYYHWLNEDIATAFHMIKKHEELDYYATELKIIHIAYDNGKFREVYTTLENLAKKTRYLKMPSSRVKDLLKKYDLSTK